MSTNSLQNTDLILVQRQDTTQNTELYAVSIENFAQFTFEHGDAYVADLTDQVNENTENINIIEGSISLLANEITILKLDVSRHDQEINLLQQDVLDVKLSIHELQSDAKVNLNYRWIEDATGPELTAGQMCAQFDAYTGEITRLFYSTTDDDGYSVSQPYIFEGETLELSSAYRPSPANPSKLRYRSVHLVLSSPQFTDGYLYFDVKTIHKFVDGTYPYYTDEDQFITRSDFYPNALNIDEFETHVEDTYLPLNGSKSMTGNLKLVKDTPRIYLNSTTTNTAYISTLTDLIFLQGDSPRFEIGSDVQCHKTLNMNSNTITGLKKDSSNASNAATVGYVDDKIADIESTIDDRFEPGDQVAKKTLTGVEQGGFALVSGTLYVRV